MQSIYRRKRAEVEVALRRGREVTYTEPLLLKGSFKKNKDGAAGDQQQHMADIQAFLSNFYRTIYKRREECRGILDAYPNSVGLYFNKFVSTDQITYEDFWQRYFFRCDVDLLLAQWDRQDKQNAAARSQAIERGLKSLESGIKGLQDSIMTNTALATEDDKSAAKRQHSSATAVKVKRSNDPKLNEKVESGGTVATSPPKTSAKGAKKAETTTATTTTAAATTTALQKKEIRNANADASTLTTLSPVRVKKREADVSPFTDLPSLLAKANARVENNSYSSEIATTREGSEEAEAKKKMAVPSQQKDRQAEGNVETAAPSPPAKKRATLSQAPSSDDNNTKAAPPRAKNKATDLVVPSLVPDALSKPSQEGSLHDGKQQDKREEPQVVSFWREETAQPTPNPVKASNRPAPPKDKNKDADSLPTTKSVGGRLMSMWGARRPRELRAKEENKGAESPSKKPAHKKSMTEEKAQITEPVTAASDTCIGRWKAFTNTPVVVPILLSIMIAFVGILLARNSPDLICSPAMPGTKLVSTKMLVAEAPWWAPQWIKEDAFSAFCPTRRRIHLEWTPTTTGGHKDGPLSELVFIDVSEEKKIFRYRNLQGGTIFQDKIVVVDRLGTSNKVTAPWIS